MGCAEQTELSLLLTDDAGITRLNAQYLGRPRPTNVLAFAQDEGEQAELNPDLLGDVVVSLDTARREASAADIDPDEHIHRLIIHGILHLMGHDHTQGRAQAREMTMLTERLLSESAPRPKPSPVKE